MKFYRSTVLGGLSLLILFASFIRFAQLADGAMNKSGVGDIATWEIFNHRAGICFWLAVAVWLAVLSLGVYSRDSKRSQLLGLCGAAIIIAPVVWLISL